MSTDADESVGGERRRQPRFELMAQVHVRKAGTAIVMELANISATGALVHMGSGRRPKWAGIGREVRLSITNPIDFETVDLVGEVVRIVEDRDGLSMGIEFASLDDAQKAGVEALVVTAQSVPPPASRKRPPPLPTMR